MWKLFNNPARRDLYISLNRSDSFPLMFYQTRWVEGESVASRAIIVWKFVVSVINHYKSLSKSKCPKNKSYDLLVKHMTEDLMLVKFQFFKGMASVLSLYLTKFQTDAPTMPFLPKFKVIFFHVKKYCVEDARKISSEIYLSFTHSEVYLSLTQQLNPKDMVNNKTDSVKILTKVINKLYDKHLSSKESDNAKL